MNLKSIPFRSLWEIRKGAPLPHLFVSHNDLIDHLLISHRNALDTASDFSTKDYVIIFDEMDRKINPHNAHSAVAE